ncbi:MAG: thiamine-phosphate kinase, partial [Candidatus Rokubacteria bacterium]|nr:thiamine-phosphate kinase [Candidatus Rokubacteria bacterium]
LELAVSGGEDYELLFTADPAAMETLAAGLRSATGVAVTVIGEITTGSAKVDFLDARGRAVEMGPGFEHFHG